jgi:hypothetical protein
MSLKIVSIPCDKGTCDECQVDGCCCVCHTKPGMVECWRALWPMVLLAVGLVLAIGIIVVAVIKILGGE